MKAQKKRIMIVKLKPKNVNIVLPQLPMPCLSSIQLFSDYILYNIFWYITEVVHTTVYYFNTISKATEKTRIYLQTFQN